MGDKWGDGRRVPLGAGTSSLRRGSFDWLTLWSALVTLMIMVNLVLQNARVLTGRGELEPSTGAVVEYWVAAGLMIAIQVGLLVRATVFRRGGLALIASAALILAVCAALVMAGAAIDWNQNAPEPTLPSDYRPCFSGDCVGG